MFMRKTLIVAVAIVAVFSLCTAELFAQGRGKGGGGRPGRGNWGGNNGGGGNNGNNWGRGDRNRGTPEEQDQAMLDRLFGGEEDGPSSGDGEDGEGEEELPLYPGTQFTDAQIAAETAKRIAKRDKDRDGKLSKYEAEGMMPEAAMEALDRNRDGNLDAGELRPFYRETLPAEKAKEILDKEVEKLLRKHDKNKDGKIEKDEFRGRDKEFEELDANNDGTASEEEIRAFAKKEFEDRHNARLPNDESRFESEAERLKERVERARGQAGQGGQGGQGGPGANGNNPWGRGGNNNGNGGSDDDEKKDEPGSGGDDEDENNGKGNGNPWQKDK